jgi:hypothetical protein
MKKLFFVVIFSMSFTCMAMDEEEEGVGYNFRTFVDELLYRFSQYLSDKALGGKVTKDS